MLLQILIAHRNKQHACRLKKALELIGLSSIHITHNGFQALEHIIRYNYKICVVDERLKGLNANDIVNALYFKSLKRKLIILGSTERIELKDSKNILTQIDLNQEDALIKIMYTVKKELESYGTTYQKSS